MKKTVLLIVMFLLTVNGHALTVISINAEWFWDGMAPHEGRIAFGAVGNPPTSRQVELEAYAIAQIINYHQADIVGLVEVEGRSVVERIAPYLHGDWRVVFKKGRDNMTGQDVALLTKLNIIEGTITNFPDTTGEYSGTKARPSKVLGVGLQREGQKYFVIVAHLISKRSDNDHKRAAQANAIAQSVVTHSSSYDHVIVMGDLNDTPDSQTLNQIKSAGLKSISSVNDYSYEYEGNQQLIDHILVSNSLAPGSTFGSIELGPISDHRAVIATFE